MKERVVELLPAFLSGDLRGQLLYVLSLLCLLLGTVLAVAAVRVRRLDVLAVAVAGAGGASWLLSTRPLEGPTLLVVLPGNGVTLADLAALPAVLIVSFLIWSRLTDR